MFFLVRISKLYSKESICFISKMELNLISCLFISKNLKEFHKKELKVAKVWLLQNV